MVDLLPPGLVEMLAEMERDLLSRRRSYHNRTFTRRLTHEKAERRLAIITPVINNLRAQSFPNELTAIQRMKDKTRVSGLYGWECGDRRDHAVLWRDTTNRLSVLRRQCGEPHHVQYFVRRDRWHVRQWRRCHDVQHSRSQGPCRGRNG